MAEVFLARAPGAGGIAKFVAIKRILPQFSDNKEFIEMFKDEAKIAINLGHSNIVAIYEFGIELGQFFLVMDYVKGRNIRQILNKMKQSDMQFSVDQIVFMAKEISGGLDHAHRCLDGTTGKPLNITHRDMSPQNVMVSFEGEIKIIDFGIAKAETQLENTRAGTIKGKFGYMSPEQAEGQQVDLRTDIFSLGVVLWELLANDRLFIANNEINTLRKIRDCNIPSLMKINSEVQPELERICLKALTKDRNLRYQTAAALHRDLSRFLNRHYPDFSPHDFSMFVKSLYADEILELNNQLVEHSKIPFREVPAPAPREADTSHSSFSAESKSDNSRTITQSPPSANPQRQFEGGDFQVQKAPNLTPPAATGSTPQNLAGNSIDFNKAAANSQNQPTVTTSLQMPNAPRMGSATVASSNASKKPKTNTISGQTNTGIRIQSEKAPASRSVFMIAAYTVAGILSYLVLTATLPQLMEPVNKSVSETFAGMWFCADSDSNHLIKTLKSFNVDQAICPPAKTEVSASQAIVSTEGKDPVATAATATTANPAGSGSAESPAPPPPPAAPAATLIGVIVNSQPSGAEIVIDGDDTKRTTPARVDLMSDKTYTLELRKKNFNTFVFQKFDPNEASSKNVHAVLEKIIIGYVDIDVQPPRFAQVFINGARVKVKNLPIIRYPVNANQPIEISAENPLSKAKDSKRIIIEEGQRKAIVLNLKRDPASTK